MLWTNEKHIEVKDRGEETEKRIGFGDTELYETKHKKAGELFKELQKEWGKASKMFVEDKDGNSKQIGWVFTKTDYYKDTKEKYIHETWIEVHSKEPKKTIKYFYHKF